MPFPSNDPLFAMNDTYEDGVTPNKVRPDESLRDYGFLPVQEVNAQELNWQLNNIALQIAELKTLSASAFQTPVNHLIFIDGDNRNPAVIYGYGTWVPFGQGRVIIGAGIGTDINGVQQSFPAGSTGGEYKHTISTSEMPTHVHQYSDDYYIENTGNLTTIPESSKRTVGFINGGIGAGRTDTDNNTMLFTNKNTESSGGGQAMNVVQPFLTVNIWRRTA